MPGITPNTPPQSPGAPGWLYYMVSLQSTQNMGAMLMLPYMADADPHMGDLADDYLTAIRTATRGAISQWLPISVGIQRDAFYWGTALGTQRWVQNTGSLGQGLVNSDYRPTQSQGLIIKASARYPRGKGRFYAPFVPTVFCEPGRNFLNSAGSAALHFLSASIAQTVHTVTVNFTPATYWAAGNAFEPVTSFSSKQQLGTWMRRSPIRNWSGAVQIAGNVWMY